MKLPNGQIIQAVTDFKYLGSKIMHSFNDFKQRRGIAFDKFWQMKNIWQTSTLTLKLRLQLFDSLILTILFYGAESWTLTKQMTSMLNSFGTTCYRFILGIKRIDHVRNEVVLETVNRLPLINTLYCKQLRALGHWLRAKENPVSRFALYKPAHGRNRRGRPRTTYIKHVENITGKTAEELKQLAMDRGVWKRSIVGLYESHAPA